MRRARTLADFRRRKPPGPLRVAATLLVLALAALFWSGTVGDFRTWRQHSDLDQRGLTTTATVLAYSYDPDGGDPDGWTTDQIRFVTETGRAVVATVGHHAPGPERTARTLTVTYDPQHPGVVRAAGYDDQADDPTNAGIGATFSLLLTAMAAVLLGRLLTTGGGAAHTAAAAAS